MKVSFNFDGERLCIKLSCEDQDERAIAGLMEGFNVASVAVDRGQYAPYHYSNEREVQGVNIVLRRPVAHAETGEA